MSSDTFTLFERLLLDDSLEFFTAPEAPPVPEVRQARREFLPMYNGPWARPLYIGLMSHEGVDGRPVEAQGPGYRRVQVNETEAVVEFPRSTGDWGLVRGAVIFDALGQPVHWFPTTTTIHVSSEMSLRLTLRVTVD